jgi:hypothetical protein
VRIGHLQQHPDLLERRACGCRDCEQLGAPEAGNLEGHGADRRRVLELVAVRPGEHGSGAGHVRDRDVGRLWLRARGIVMEFDALGQFRRQTPAPRRLARDRSRALPARTATGPAHMARRPTSAATAGSGRATG